MPRRSEKRQCEHTLASGRRCRAAARAGSRFCYFHDPAVSAQRDAARRAGGRERSRQLATLPTDTPDVPLTSIGDVCQLLAQTINQTRRGELDPRIANATGYLASVLLRGLQDSDVEQRLAALEAANAAAGGQGGPR